MPPHGSTTTDDDQKSSRLAMFQKGLTKKLHAGSSKLFNKNESDGYDMHESSPSLLDGANRLDEGYSKNQVVWYKAQGKKPKKAKILSIDMDDVYTIKLLESGREKQTDSAHLKPLGPGDEAGGNSHARFKIDQIVFHKPSDGSPIFLAQIIKVYPGDGQPLYDIRLQGSNTEKFSIKEVELLDMNEAPGLGSNPKAQSPAVSARLASSRQVSKSPTRMIKKVLSSEGLKEMKRSVKKASSMEGLDAMKRSLLGKSSERNPAKAAPVQGDLSRQASGRSTRSNEGMKGSRIKKTNSMEGLKEMMMGTQQPSNASLEGAPRARRPGVKKSKSMEGMRDMMQASKSAHPAPVRRPPPHSASMNMSGHNQSVRAQRPPPRTQAEKEELDRQRGVQRSKSLEGMHPRHLRRPASRERLGGPGMPQPHGGPQNQTWQSEHGPPRPPGRPGSQHGQPLSNSMHGQPPPGRRPPPRARSADRIPIARTNSMEKSIGGMRRPVPPPPGHGPSMTPPRMMNNKKPAYSDDDDDSEESSISSVSWQGKAKQPRSFKQPPIPTTRDAPKPTEITVDMDDASSVSSEDSSWESFREKPKKSKKSAGMKEQWKQRRDADRNAEPVKKEVVRHPPKVVGVDIVSGAELVLETVYSSDEESDHPAGDLPEGLEPEDLFEWAN